ncbi:stage III sporulation protein AF [Paenibacillus sp. NPDC058071]|uniref:stage III sporulation protein AF n=1 Tax=Paenibacillus sp. NPDC058071 TaxID=3346326 RepID=UPI0036D82B61
MVAWLSEWLRNIIAVIMLAVFMELLLPNKAMLRYARLVIGLLILLIILTPLLKLLQGDFESRLTDGISLWEENAASRQVKMPSLSDIRKNADKLAEKRNEEATALTEQTLEKAMKADIEEKTGVAVERVEAALQWKVNGSERTPVIKSVVVTFAAASQRPPPQETDESAVKEVEAVKVDVRVDDIAAFGNEGSTEASGAEQADSEEEGRQKADPALEKLTRGVLSSNWGVSPTLVSISQRSDGQQRETR